LLGYFFAARCKGLLRNNFSRASSLFKILLGGSRKLKAAVALKQIPDGFPGMVALFALGRQDLLRLQRLTQVVLWSQVLESCLEVAQYPVELRAHRTALFLEICEELRQLVGISKFLEVFV
jgi:hypothetical protein